MAAPIVKLARRLGENKIEGAEFHMAGLMGQNNLVPVEIIFLGGETIDLGRQFDNDGLVVLMGRQPTSATATARRARRQENLPSA